MARERSSICSRLLSDEGGSSGRARGSRRSGAFSGTASSGIASGRIHVVIRARVWKKYGSSVRASQYTSQPSYAVGGADVASPPPVPRSAASPRPRVSVPAAAAVGLDRVSVLPLDRIALEQRRGAAQGAREMCASEPAANRTTICTHQIFPGATLLNPPVPRLVGPEALTMRALILLALFGAVWATLPRPPVDWARLLRDVDPTADRAAGVLWDAGSPPDAAVLAGALEAGYEAYGSYELGPARADAVVRERVMLDDIADPTFQPSLPSADVVVSIDAAARFPSAAAFVHCVTQLRPRLVLVAAPSPGETALRRRLSATHDRDEVAASRAAALELTLPAWIEAFHNAGYLASVPRTVRARNALLTRVDGDSARLLAGLWLAKNLLVFVRASGPAAERPAVQHTLALERLAVASMDLDSVRWVDVGRLRVDLPRADFNALQALLVADGTHYAAWVVEVNRLARAEEAKLRARDVVGEGPGGEGGPEDGIVGRGDSEERGKGVEDGDVDEAVGRSGQGDVAGPRPSTLQGTIRMGPFLFVGETVRVFVLSSWTAPAFGVCVCACFVFLQTLARPCTSVLLRHSRGLNRGGFVLAPSPPRLPRTLDPHRCLPTLCRLRLRRLRSRRHRCLHLRRLRSRRLRCRLHLFRSAPDQPPLIRLPRRSRTYLE